MIERTTGAAGTRGCLTVVMPCYNEETTILEVVKRVLESPYTGEVVVVDDASNDGSREVLATIDDPRVRVMYQPCNLGKGAALRRGFAEATRPFVIVQDADLEYDPTDYDTVLGPLLDGRADVVYGSRFHTSRPHRVLYFWHSVGNRFLTLVSNMFTNLNLSDMETCYKAFRREVIQSVAVDEDRFGFEPEITSKLAKAGWRIYEVGISYDGRTYEEGKKIGWKDGVRAFWCVFRYSRLWDRVVNLFRPPVPTRTPADFASADGELADVLDSLQDADNYADWIHDLMRPYVGGHILEIGAGHVEFTERLVENGDVTATDVSERCLDLLRERFQGDPRVQVRHFDPFDDHPGERFDAVVLVNVLEHLPDDGAALARLYDVVEPGGALVLFVPALEVLYSRFDRLIGHYRRYRPRLLARACQQAGFGVENVRYVNSAGALAWFLFARLLGQTPTRDWSVRFYDRNVVPALRRLETVWRPPFGQSVLCVVRRPAADAVTAAPAAPLPA